MLDETDITQPFHFQAAHLEEGSDGRNRNIQKLIDAMRKGDLKTIKNLIGQPNSPLDPYMRNKDGETLVHLAVRNEAPMNVLEQLEEHGLFLELSTNTGANAIHIAIEWGVSPAYLKTLLNAFTPICLEGEVHASLTRATLSGMTPSYLAVSRGEHALLEVLLDHGLGDLPNKGHRYGQTCLHLAVDLDDVIAVKLLMNHKRFTEIGSNITSQNRNGRTPVFGVRSMAVFIELMKRVDWTLTESKKGGTAVEVWLAEAAEIAPFRTPRDKHRFCFITSILRKLLTSGLYDWGINRALKSPRIAPKHKALFMWRKLQLLVRGKTLPLFSLSTPLHTLRYAASVLRLDRPRIYSCGSETEKLVLRRLLRNNLMPYINWESDVLRSTNTMMELTPLHQIPREWVFLVRINSKITYAFDLREVVWTKKNPYTKTAFSPPVYLTMQKRYAQILALRSSLVELGELDGGEVLVNLIKENQQKFSTGRRPRVPRNRGGRTTNDFFMDLDAEDPELSPMDTSANEPLLSTLGNAFLEQLRNSIDEDAMDGMEMESDSEGSDF